MSTPHVSGRRVDQALTGFYGLVALVALAGQVGAARQWLGWPLLFALPAVASVEAGGIVLSIFGDHRRQLGERALVAQALSAAVAAGAVTVNWLGHANHLQGGFFAGLSALGYGVWLLHSGARRRDGLRAKGDLPPVPPAYGLWQWLRRPALTARARALALADPLRRSDPDRALGVYESLAAARAAVRAERQHAAISTVLHRKIRAAVDPTTADIAVNVYDLDAIAARLAGGADYDGLTALIAADLVPARLAPAPAGSTVIERDTEPRPVVAPVPPQTTADVPPTVSRIAADAPEVAAVECPAAEVVSAQVAAPDGGAECPDIEVPAPMPRKPRKPAVATTPTSPRRSAEVTRQAARAMASGGVEVPDIAALLGVTERHVRRSLAAVDAGTNASVKVNGNMPEFVEGDR